MNLKWNAVERGNHVWRKLVEEMRAERDLLREKNDDPTLLHEQTQVLRGRIRMLTDLLALDEAPEQEP